MQASVSPHASPEYPLVQVHTTAPLPSAQVLCVGQLLALHAGSQVPFQSLS
jgi:hypothetical protein